MKSLIMSLSLLFGACAPCLAAEWKEMFKQTEGNLVDFAVASAVEPGYFRDLIEGRNSVGAQSPIVYVTPYLSADWGYVAGYENASRGSLMVGGTIRVNRLIQDMLGDKVSLFRSIAPVVDSNWDRLWFGPFISHSFTDQNLAAGIKAGLSF